VLLAAMASMLVGAQGFRNDVAGRLLASHNRERATLGLQPMRWNPELAEGAKDWAEHLASTGRFEHSPDLPGQPLLGENIWGGTPGAYQPEGMVGLWIAEKRHFKPGIFPAVSTTQKVGDISHYTQVVWSDTREVGCGLVEASEEEILVCRYNSPGNIRGRKPY
jgi:hypothetical protein